MAHNEAANTATAGIIVLRDSVYPTYGTEDVPVAFNDVCSPAMSVSKGGIHVARLTVADKEVTSCAKAGISVAHGNAVSILPNRVVTPGEQGIHTASTVTGVL